MLLSQTWGYRTNRSRPRSPQKVRFSDRSRSRRSPERPRSRRSPERSRQYQPASAPERSRQYQPASAPERSRQYQPASSERSRQYQPTTAPESRRQYQPASVPDPRRADPRSNQIQHIPNNFIHHGRMHRSFRITKKPFSAYPRRTIRMGEIPAPTGIQSP